VRSAGTSVSARTAGQTSSGTEVLFL